MVIASSTGSLELSNMQWMLLRLDPKCLLLVAFAVAFDAVVRLYTAAHAFIFGNQHTDLTTLYARLYSYKPK